MLTVPGAVDQVGSGILKAAIRQSELIVRRQPAFLPQHPRQKQRRRSQRQQHSQNDCLQRGHLPVTREKNRLTIEFWNFGKVQSECTNCVAMPSHTRQPMLPERMRAKIFSRASPKVGFAL